MVRPKSAEAGDGANAHSHKSAAPPPRRSGFSDPELEDVRKDRTIAVLCRRITSSDPAVMINTRGFSDEDVREAASRVASLWIKGGYVEKAEVLVRTYKLIGEEGKGGEGPAQASEERERLWWPDSLGGEWELLDWRARMGKK